MLKDNPFIKGLSSVCTGEEGKEGRKRGETKSKRKIKWLPEGHKESAGPARLSSALNASTGTLCQENAFSNNQGNVCLTSGGKHTVFPSRQRKGQWWLLALAALRAQSLTNLPRTGLAEKSYSFVVEITARESFGSTGASLWWRHKQFLLQSWQIMARESGWINLGVLSRKKEESDPFQPWHSWKGSSRAVPSLHCASVSSCGVGLVWMWLLRRLMESWGCSEVDRDSLGRLSLAFPSAVPSRQTDRQTDWGRCIPRASQNLLLWRHLVI